MSRKCDYRKTIECRFSDLENRDYLPCELCLAGQQIDTTELLTSAIMELGIDRLEKEECK